MAILPKQRNRLMANDTESRVSTLETTLQEFISQTGRLLGDHGSRLSRTEAQIESLLAVFQASDRRLNQLEQTVAANAEAIRSLQQVTQNNAEAIGGLQEVTRGNTEAIGSLQEVVGYLREVAQSNNQNIQVLADLAQSNEVRFRQLAESQAGVLSRMDDVIAVMRERL